MIRRSEAQSFSRSQPSLKFASKARKAQPEAELQKKVVQWLRMTAKPGVLFFSVPNEGKRSVRLGAHYKAMGLRPGVADLVVIVRGSVLFIELKHGGGQQSENQRGFMADAIAADCGYAVARSLDDALDQLRLWGAIKEAA